MVSAEFIESIAQTCQSFLSSGSRNSRKKRELWSPLLQSPGAKAHLPPFWPMDPTGILLRAVLPEGVDSGSISGRVRREVPQSGGEPFTGPLKTEGKGVGC